MAITDKEQGVWQTDQVYNKIMEGDIWVYTGDGAGFMWGNNDEGGLGINLGSNSERRSSPVQLPGSWKEMSVTGDNNYGTKTDGSLWAWGNNEYGELGLGNKTKYSSPMQIGTDTTWRRVTNGPTGAIATKTDGTLWAWGRNENGVLAQNTEGDDRSSPVQIPGTWSDNFESGGDAVSAVKTDGSLWFWGRNSEGVFGLNSPSPPNMRRSSPVQLPGTWSTTKGQGCATSQTAIS